MPVLSVNDIKAAGGNVGTSLNKHVGDDTPILLIGGDHPYKQWFGNNGSDGLAGLYASRGIKPYMAINTGSHSGEGAGDPAMMSWDQIGQLSSNVDVISHGVRHYADWEAPDSGIFIKYTGAAVSGAVHVTSTNIIGTTTGGTDDFSLSLTTYPTLSLLLNAINLLPNWECIIMKELSGEERSDSLMTIAPANKRECKVASTLGTGFSCAGGIVIYWDSSVVWAKEVVVEVHSTVLRIYKDGPLIASITYAGKTMGDILAEVRAVSPALNTTDLFGEYNTRLCIDNRTGPTALGTGDEEATNLAKHHKYSRLGRCNVEPFTATCGGLTPSYLRRRNIEQSKVQAAANGISLKCFAQSGGKFFKDYTPEVLDVFEHFRGNSKYTLYGVQASTVEDCRQGFHTHLSLKNSYNSNEGIDSIVDSLIDSRGFVVDLLVHNVLTDAPTQDGSIAGSSGYFLAGTSGDITEAPFVYLLDRLSQAQKEGKIRIVTPAELNSVVAVSRTASNLVYNPNLVVRENTALNFTDTVGRMYMGYWTDGNGFANVQKVSGGLKFSTSSATSKDVLIQSIDMKPGRFYKVKVAAELSEGATTDNFFAQLIFASTNGIFPNQFKQNALTLRTIDTSQRYMMIEQIVHLPSIENTQEAQIIGDVTGPFNLSSNNTITLKMPGISALSINCATGAVSSSAVTASEVANAINTAIQGSALFSSAQQYWNCASVRDNRVIITANNLTRDLTSTGELAITGGTATTAIFGGATARTLAGVYYFPDTSIYPIKIGLRLTIPASSSMTVNKIIVQEI